MSRRKQDVTGVRISDEEYSRLENKFEALKNEFIACKRKLDSKCEALLILSKELDQCRSERDQFKLMAEQLRERHQSMKKQISGQLLEPKAYLGSRQGTDKQNQNLLKLLCEARDNNKSLEFELEDTKQKLHDAQGDIKLLREQIARQRVGTTDEGMNTRHFPAHEREELVQKLESSREQYLQLERDLQTVLDEKEELVTERDVYKTKYERLNQELNYILKGDENRVVDIDALVMENKYLQDRLKQMEEEKSMAMAAVSKYKSLLEKKKNKSCMKLGQTRGGGLVISQKQVQEVLTSKAAVVPTAQAMSDLQALAGALLDTVNDKNLALSHQRKTNKILGNRVAELEKKIKTLEVAGLWNVSGQGPLHLEKLLQECNDMKTLIPQQVSHSGDTDHLSVSEEDKDSELGSVTPLDSCATSPEPSPTHTAQAPNHLQLGDLDLLPTKEVPHKPACVDHTANSITNDVQNTVSLVNNGNVASPPMNPVNDPKRTNYHRHESEHSVQSGLSGEILTSSSSSIDEQNDENNPSSDSINNTIGESQTSDNINNTIGESQTGDSINNAIGESQISKHDLCDKVGEIGTEKVDSVGSMKEETETVTAMENIHGYKEDMDLENEQVNVYNGDNVEGKDNYSDESGTENVHEDLNLDPDKNSGINGIMQTDSSAGEDEKLEKSGNTNKDGNDPENDYYNLSEVGIDHEKTENSDEEEDRETSEKIGLLVGSMAEKLCNISHKKTAQKVSSELREENPGLNDDIGGKLCQNANEGKESTVADEPHNIEC